MRRVLDPPQHLTKEDLQLLRPMELRKRPTVAAYVLSDGLALVQQMAL